MSWLPVVVTVAPTSEPVTLADAKAHCRVDGSDDDDWLTSQIKAARHLIEQRTGTKLVTQTVVMRCSSWNDLENMPTAPIASVSGITYLDVSGASQTLDTGVYESVLVGLDPIVRLKVNQSWPTARAVSDAITITAVAGSSVVEEDIKAACLMLLEQWYEERTGVAIGHMTTVLPNTVDALLTNHRRF